jgi:hypothetical protein
MQVTEKKRTTFVRKTLAEDDLVSDLTYWKQATAREKFARVWQLSREAYQLAGSDEPESRLQRSVVRLRRG